MHKSEKVTTLTTLVQFESTEHPVLEMFNGIILINLKPVRIGFLIYSIRLTFFLEGGYIDNLRIVQLIKLTLFRSGGGSRDL